MPRPIGENLKQSEMSYYTTLKPDKADFENHKGETLELAVARFKRYSDTVEGLWQVLFSLCFHTPHSLTEVRELSEKFITDYKEAYYQWFRAGCLVGLLADGKLSYNKYEYNHDPQDGVMDSKRRVNSLFCEISGLICATPKDICPEKDDEGNVVEPADWLIAKLNGLRELLNDALCDLHFSKVAVKYWDTHGEG